MRKRWTTGAAWLALAGVVMVAGLVVVGARYAWTMMAAQPGGNAVTGAGQPAGTSAPTTAVGSGTSSADWLRAFGDAANEFITPGADGKGLSANLRGLFGNQTANA